MGDRLELHNELLNFCPNVYFQPPSSKTMEYPCIVYNKTGKSRQFGNDHIYLTKQEYQITVMDRDPDTKIPDNVESHFQYCVITQYYTVNNLNHTNLNLFY